MWQIYPKELPPYEKNAHLKNTIFKIDSFSTHLGLEAALTNQDALEAVAELEVEEVAVEEEEKRNLLHQRKTLIRN